MENKKDQTNKEVQKKETEITIQGDIIRLTKREYFAAAAMQGLLANSSPRKEPAPWVDPIDYEVVAGRSIMCADALLNLLEKSQSNKPDVSVTLNSEQLVFILDKKPSKNSEGPVKGR